MKKQISKFEICKKRNLPASLYFSEEGMSQKKSKITKTTCFFLLIILNLADIHGAITSAKHGVTQLPYKTSPALRYPRSFLLVKNQPLSALPLATATLRALARSTSLVKESYPISSPPTLNVGHSSSTTVNAVSVSCNVRFGNISGMIASLCSGAPERGVNGASNLLDPEGESRYGP